MLERRIRRWKMFDKIILGIIVLSLAVVGGSACAKSEAAELPTVPTASGVQRGHVIQEITPTPVKPNFRDYIFNTAEYYIAANTLSVDQLERRLRQAGYNLSQKQITAFQEQYGVKKGDIVQVRGRVIASKGSPLGEGVSFQSPYYLDAYTGLMSRPQWLREALEKIAAGQEVIVTLRCTVLNAAILTNCEFIK